MKNYQKKYNVGNPTPNPLSILPEYEATLDPTPGRIAVLLYNNKGDYIGWCSPETMKKFLYGKLYYKTKGLFSINTAKNNRVSGAKTVSIKEKATGNIALIAVTKTIDEGDLVDASNVKDKAVYQLKHEIGNYKFNDYNWTSIPDKYNLLKGFKEELVKSTAEWMSAQEAAKQKYFSEMKKKVMDQLQSIIDSEDALKAGGEEAGMNIDF